jgi:SpoVK/Ycf46/Vps4 family AAA+-type ATPase
VKDAHDRYANIETSYLLQRMEAYEGLAILATNFRQNLDSAFARRLQVVIEFPFPQAGDRERLWRQLLPAAVPQAEDLDLAYLAQQFTLSGGNIKNCVLTAAFAAAAGGGNQPGLRG